MDQFRLCLEPSHANECGHNRRRHRQKDDETDGSQGEYLMFYVVGKISHDTGNPWNIEKVERKEAHVIEHRCEQFRPFNPEVDQERRCDLIKRDENLHVPDLSDRVSCCFSEITRPLAHFIAHMLSTATLGVTSD